MSAYYAADATAPVTEQSTPAPVLVAFAGSAPQSRLTVAFRLLLAIPQLIVLWLLGVAAGVITIIGWFGALFTGRLPVFAADFLTGYLRWLSRVYAYNYLLTDAYPPFTLDDADYPVRLAVTPGRLNRLAVLFRFFLLIPCWIVQAVVSYGALTIFMFVTWLIVLVTGQMPDAIHQGLAAVLRYQVGTLGFATMLTSAYPGGLFGDPPAQAGYGDPQAQPEYGAQPGYGAQPEYAQAGYGAPAAGPAGGLSWRLVLSAAARKLVILLRGGRGPQGGRYAQHVRRGTARDRHAIAGGHGQRRAGGRGVGYRGEVRQAEHRSLGHQVHQRGAGVRPAAVGQQDQPGLRQPRYRAQLVTAGNTDRGIGTPGGRRASTLVGGVRGRLSGIRSRSGISASPRCARRRRVHRGQSGLAGGQCGPRACRRGAPGGFHRGTANPGRTRRPGGASLCGPHVRRPLDADRRPAGRAAPLPGRRAVPAGDSRRAAQRRAGHELAFRRGARHYRAGDLHPGRAGHRHRDRARPGAAPVPAGFIPASAARAHPAGAAGSVHHERGGAGAEARAHARSALINGRLAGPLVPRLSGQGGHERLLRHVHAADGLHPLLAFLLPLQQLALARDVT